MDKQTNKPLYIITGATDAMGSVVTQNLAEAGHAIVMACFDTEKSDAKAKELAIRTRNKDITSMHLDLGSFASVRSFANQIKALNRPVAVLVNNANYISHRSEMSPDGYEKLVQVNFLSTALLSLLIRPLMIEGGRIIFSTSLSHTPVSIPYEFPAVSNFMPIAAYAQSKMALSLFSIYLSTVFRTQHVAVNSVDSGLVNLSKLGMNRFISRFRFISNHTVHPEANTNADLFVVPVTGGEAKCITADNKAWDGTPKYSPDGRYIAYRFQVVPGHESDRFRLALYDRATGEKRVLTEDIDNWVNDDYLWTADSKSIYFGVQELGAVPIYKVDVKSGKHAKVLPDRAVATFCLGNDGYLYYTYSTTGKPSALYRMKNGGKTEQQLTFLNQELDIRPSEVMWVEGAEGAKIHVFVVKPHDFDPNKKYPLVINVHGGPQMQWMNSFRADWQVYPGAGYVIAYPNPHGSTGYGQDFTTSISGDWGGKPYEDVIKVTEALAKLPYVDADRMGAMGWSYGGYFMNWLQGHDHPFKCLASMMGLYDLRSMWGTTEELWFPNFDLKGQPWNSELYKKWSPSEYVENFKTPTLILTGERDYRVSYTQSIQYFSVLQTLGIPSRLIVFSNDGHWPDTMNSMPVYYNAHLEWFHKYLGGDPAPWDTHKMMNNEVEY